MSQDPSSRGEARLSVRAGRWFEAQATGWGVWALPIVLALILAAGLLVVLSENR